MMRTLGLSGAERGFDHRLEAHAALQQVLRAFGWREWRPCLRARGTDFHTQAGEGIERLENLVVEVLRKLSMLAQEAGFGHGFVFQKRKRKLADEKEPVGVPGPFDFQFVLEAEIGLNVAADQFIRNGAVVNSLDGDVAEYSLLPRFCKIADIHCPDPAESSR